MREHLADPWTLDALADEAHLSRSQLARAFDATVGVSPMAYLRKMRVERMARLLASTDMTIAEAARSVGWRNQFHASQCFHAAYGVSLRPWSDVLGLLVAQLSLQTDDTSQEHASEVQVLPVVRVLAKHCVELSSGARHSGSLDRRRLR
jgi:AraC-like DNA-binding protein